MRERTWRDPLDADLLTKETWREVRQPGPHRARRAGDLGVAVWDDGRRRYRLEVLDADPEAWSEADLVALVEAFAAASGAATPSAAGARLIRPVSERYGCGSFARLYLLSHQTSEGI
ncbi:MAG: hypothetical protein M3Q03_07850 [Chloroflexota bacterium]|nr:hypothetical protein [Chloroflexota bacterium]